MSKIETEADLKHKDKDKYDESEQRKKLKEIVGVPNKRVWCSLPWYSLQLKQTQKFGPCCHLEFDGVETPKNLKETMDLWNHPKFQKLREDLLNGNVDEYPCAKCYDRVPRYGESKDFDDGSMIYGMGKFPKRGNGINTQVHKFASEEYVSGKIKLSTHPQHLYFYSNERCNYACIMCTQRFHTKDFQSDNFIKIIEEIGLGNLDQFGAVGGETLLTKDVH